jgi:hypothetical protein
MPVFSLGPIEVLIVAILVAGVPGVIWSWIDASQGLFRPFRRPSQIAAVLSALVIPFFLLYGYTVLGVAVLVVVFVLAWVASLLGYALGPAPSKRRQISHPEISESNFDSTRAPVETGNPYQPPES